jgi:hypothetical protein
LESRQQSDHETCHTILLGQKGLDLLLVPTSAGLCLPSVEIPRRQRPAESITAAVRTKWGFEAICLFSPEVAPLDIESTQDIFAVLELCHRAETSDAWAVWVPTNSLSQQSFADAKEYSVVQQSLTECKVVAGSPMPRPFAAVGWFEQLLEWVEEASHPLKLQLNGRFRQLNASPSFSLIRFETNGRAIWFKAVGEPNLREFSITLTLAELFPECLPPIFAVRPEWNGWLSLESEGIELQQTRDLDHWKDAAKTLARLQVRSTSQHGKLRDCGARDLTTIALPNLVEPLLHVLARLMEEQVAFSPAPLTEMEVLSLGDQIETALSVLRELAVPQALGHLDLNPGNIVVSRNGCNFLDWAEAYIGHPFLSFEYFLEHYRRNVGVNTYAEVELTAAYSEPWEEMLSPDVISRSLAVSPLLAIFAYAVGNNVWNDQEKLKVASTSGYFRSLTRRMKREAGQLFDRSSLCL